MKVKINNVSIDNLIKEYNYSNNSIAKLLNTSSSAVSRWRQGTTKAIHEKYIDELCALFNIDRSVIVLDEVNATNTKSKNKKSKKSESSSKCKNKTCKESTSSIYHRLSTVVINTKCNKILITPEPNIEYSIPLTTNETVSLEEYILILKTVNDNLAEDAFADEIIEIADNLVKSIGTLSNDAKHKLRVIDLYSILDELTYLEYLDTAYDMICSCKAYLDIHKLMDCDDNVNNSRGVKIQLLNFNVNTTEYSSSSCNKIIHFYYDYFVNRFNDELGLADIEKLIRVMSKWTLKYKYHFNKHLFKIIEDDVDTQAYSIIPKDFLSFTVIDPNLEREKSVCEVPFPEDSTVIKKVSPSKDTLNIIEDCEEFGESVSKLVFDCFSDNLKGIDYDIKTNQLSITYMTYNDLKPETHTYTLEDNVLDFDTYCLILSDFHNYLTNSEWLPVYGFSPEFVLDSLMHEVVENAKCITTMVKYVYNSDELYDLLLNYNYKYLFELPYDNRVTMIKVMRDLFMVDNLLVKELNCTFAGLEHLTHRICEDFSVDHALIDSSIYITRYVKERFSTFTNDDCLRLIENIMNFLYIDYDNYSNCIDDIHNAIERELNIISEVTSSDCSTYNYCTEELLINLVKEELIDLDKYELAKILTKIEKLKRKHR